ncbi:hypothetical protein F53441_2472 [Fusarium austroafricanum]|uniref:Uncharacterized protein n=1 Tax=Fusarium austroafricanum TaxID=2364996 RepID=A0A8H4KPZ6_9HYPO|nr:hypothetical protein F53441_2472 [Fusarium austroafricanum]
MPYDAKYYFPPSLLVKRRPKAARTDAVREANSITEKGLTGAATTSLLTPSGAVPTGPSAGWYDTEYPMAVGTT